MSKSCLLRLFGILLLLLGSTIACCSQRIEITGIVVAHVPCTAHGGSEPIPIQTLLIHVEEVLVGKVDSEYVIASLYYQGDGYIKPEKFDGKSIWYFRLESAEHEPFIAFRDVLYSSLLDAETGKLIQEYISLQFLVDQSIIKDIGVSTRLPNYRFERDDYKTSLEPTLGKVKQSLPHKK